MLSLMVLAQEPLQLDRTIHDPSLMDFVQFAPSSPLLSVDVANVTIVSYASQPPQLHCCSHPWQDLPYFS